MMLQATSVYRVPYTQHVTSTVQKLIKGMPRTGLNRHKRGYAIEEAASGVHFQDVGSYRARPVSIFKLHLIIIIVILILSIT